VGVALDSAVEAGLSILQSFGSFDEVNVGNGLNSTGALRYIWQDSLPFAAVPQLVVIERKTVVVDSPYAVQVADGPPIRLTGVPAIAAWTHRQLQPIEAGN
jgi:hypothetical protein